MNQNNSYGNPSIAVNNNGSFVISWLGSVNLYPKTIYCQMYSPNGIQIGNNVQVNENGSDTIDDRSYPDVAFDSSGIPGLVCCAKDVAKRSVLGQREC